MTRHARDLSSGCIKKGYPACSCSFSSLLFLKVPSHQANVTWNSALNITSTTHEAKTGRLSYERVNLVWINVDLLGIIPLTEAILRAATFPLLQSRSPHHQKPVSLGLPPHTSSSILGGIMYEPENRWCCKSQAMLHICEAIRLVNTMACAGRCSRQPNAGEQIRILAQWYQRSPYAWYFLRCP